MMTFPQVIIDGELVGGFTEVQAAAESGRLDELLLPEDQPAGRSDRYARTRLRRGRGWQVSHT